MSRAWYSSFAIPVPEEKQPELAERAGQPAEGKASATSFLGRALTSAEESVAARETSLASLEKSKNDVQLLACIALLPLSARRPT